MAHSPDAAFSSPALLRAGKCSDPKRVNWQFYISLFPRVDVTIFFICFMKVDPTLSIISVGVGLMFTLYFEFVLWYTRKAKGGGPVLTIASYLTKGCFLVPGSLSCQTNSYYWFLNDFCSFSRYWGAHGCASIFVVCINSSGYMPRW